MIRDVPIRHVSVQRPEKMLSESSRLTKREVEKWNALSKQKAPTAEPDGREAELERLGDFELCWDLARKFARESANRTRDMIADIRDRYEAIALGLRCARGAQSSEAPLALCTALNALAQEFERDRKGLLRFLSAVFKRWRKIDQSESPFRQLLLTHQLTGTPKEIANALEEIGAAPTCTTAKQVESFHARIRQYRSRGRKAASKRRGL